MNRSFFISLIGAVIVVLLQASIAPAMQIGPAVPNFILAYVLALAIVRPEGGLIMPFVLGLLFDLMGSGPVGGMAAVCVVTSFALSRLLIVLNNDTLFIPIVLIVAGAVLGNVLYGILVLACGADISAFDALVGRALPCGLYDTVLALVLFPVLLRLMRLGESQMRMP